VEQSSYNLLDVVMIPSMMSYQAAVISWYFSLVAKAMSIARVTSVNMKMPIAMAMLKNLYRSQAVSPG
jgi:hypothetical protein